MGDNDYKLGEISGRLKALIKAREQDSEKLDRIYDRLSHLERDLTGLKVKAGLIGTFFGGLASVIGSLIFNNLK